VASEEVAQAVFLVIPDAATLTSTEAVSILVTLGPEIVPSIILIAHARPAFIANARVSDTALDARESPAAFAANVTSTALDAREAVFVGE